MKILFKKRKIKIKYQWNPFPFLYIKEKLNNEK